MNSEITGCCFISAHSSSSSGPGFWRMPSGYPDLADVVQERSDLDRVEIGPGVPEPRRERHGDARHALGVLAGVVVLGRHRARQGRDRLEVRLANLLDERRRPEGGPELRDDRIAQPVPALAVSSFDAEPADDLLRRKRAPFRLRSSKGPSVIVARAPTSSSSAVSAYSASAWAS